MTLTEAVRMVHTWDRATLKQKVSDPRDPMLDRVCRWKLADTRHWQELRFLIRERDTCDSAA